MRKFRVFLAAILVLPLVAFGSFRTSDTALASMNPQEFIPAGADGASAYECCFIYFMGHWWCVPCS
jgi:hypothetical protein